jgi:hypothetical protein
MNAKGDEKPRSHGFVRVELKFGARLWDRAHPRRSRERRIAAIEGKGERDGPSAGMAALHTRTPWLYSRILAKGDDAFEASRTKREAVCAW